MQVSMQMTNVDSGFRNSCDIARFIKLQRVEKSVGSRLTTWMPIFNFGVSNVTDYIPFVYNFDL